MTRVQTWDVQQKHRLSYMILLLNKGTPNNDELVKTDFQCLRLKKCKFLNSCSPAPRLIFLHMGPSEIWIYTPNKNLNRTNYYYPRILGYPVFRQTQSTCLIWADDGGSNLCIEKINYTQSNTKLNSHTTMMNDCFYWLVDFSNLWANFIWKTLAGQKCCFLWTIMTRTFETLVHGII